MKVQRQQGSKQWGVYFNGELVEGGFFTRDAAEDCAKYHAREMSKAEPELPVADVAETVTETAETVTA